MPIRPTNAVLTRASTPLRMVLATMPALLLMLAAGSVLAPAQATPGNSADAKLCQKGGYQKLYTSTGAIFSNEGKCTSYAAQDGTLSSSPYAAAVAQCTSFGGVFTAAPADGFGYRCVVAHGDNVQISEAGSTCRAEGGDSFEVGHYSDTGALYFVCGKYGTPSSI